MPTRPSPAYPAGGKVLNRDGGEHPSKSTTQPSLMLKRWLKTSPDNAFAAWTDPTKMARWFGPENCELHHVETDLRIGGRFRIIMREDTGEEHDVSGAYREIVPAEKLVFTWAWRSTPDVNRSRLFCCGPTARERCSPSFTSASSTRPLAMATTKAGRARSTSWSAFF